jgi:hypothetical protein
MTPLFAIPNVYGSSNVPNPARTKPRPGVALTTSLPITASFSQVGTSVSIHFVPSQPNIVPTGPVASCNLL